MKFSGKVGERGQIVIPKAIRDSLGIDKNSAIEFEMKGAVVTLTPKRDMRRFDQGIKKWQGAFRGKFLAAGYTSVDEYIKEVRGR